MAWPTSGNVSRALLECVRTRGIVRQHLMKRGVSLNLLDDVVSEIALVMQMKMLQKLEDIGDVYSSSTASRNWWSQTGGKVGQHGGWGGSQSVIAGLNGGGGRVAGEIEQ